MVSTTKSYPAERRVASTHPSASSLEAPALSRLRAIAHVLRLRRRQHQTISGAPAAFIVASGVLALSSGSNSDRAVIIEVLYPGDVFISTDVPAVPDAQLCASTIAECWRIPLAALQNEIMLNGALGNEIIARQSAQRSRLQLHIAVLASLTSEERVAALLIEAACRLGTENGSGIVFELPWSRNEVAEYLSLNADTLSRIMSKLTHANILARLSRSQLVIRDWNSLLALTPLADAVMALHRPPLKG